MLIEPSSAIAPFDEPTSAVVGSSHDVSVSFALTHPEPSPESVLLLELVPLDEAVLSDEAVPLGEAGLVGGGGASCGEGEIV